MHKVETRHHVDDLSRISFFLYKGRCKKMGDKLISVLLDAAGQPENTDCEN